MMLQEIISFVTVLVVAICIASAVSVLYAFGLRLLSRASESASSGVAIGLHRAPAHIFTRLAAAMCFALCAAIVIFALWLMIPAFH